jgi:iron complex transport system substrate-binding protein
MKTFTIFLLIFLASSTLAITLADASDSDYTLGIFGNANMDERIDEMDVAYVEGIINGTNDPTNLSDADHDGEIDAQDIDQIKNIINGDEKELTIVDAQNRNVTLKVPIERAISVNTGAIEIMRAIGVDINAVLIGVTSYALKDPLYWPELQDKVSVKYGSPDYEKIAQLKPDLVILYSRPNKEESFEKFEKIGVPVICLNCHDQDVLDGDVKILGELFDKRDKANDLIEWYNGYKDIITGRTKSLSDNERPKALFYGYPDSYYPALKARTGQSGDHAMLVGAGGINIAENLPSSTGTADVDPEWIMSQNPDIIVASVLGGGFSGYSANETAGENMLKIQNILLADPAINATNAGKDGRVFIMCTDLNRGPMEVAGMASLAKYFHPELFEDLHPEEILKEYFEEWQEIPYRGTYVYPPLE